MILTNAIVTAYCACHICCGSWSATNKTVDGHTPKQGITVAASRSIPFGTKVLIDGHTYIVQDRLAKRFDNRIDVYFNNHRDALVFGKKRRDVTVITAK